MSLTLVVLAAGMGSRYGGLKQCDPVGPAGETIMDYSVYDALRAGFKRVIFVIRRDFEKEFRSTVGIKYERAVTTEYAFQSIDDLPEGFAVPPGRAKPWGTAHAVRAARDLINEPFAVINADDFYGADSFRQLAVFLKKQPSNSTHFALVGFRLGQTLSKNGSVARGLCAVDTHGRLTAIREITAIESCPEGARDNSDPRNPLYFSGSERVSMNLWGFTTVFMDELISTFPEFLRSHGDDVKSEWFIPSVVDRMISQGSADVSLLPTEDAWFGITYREDKPGVVATISALVEQGVYPGRLW